LNAYLMSKGAAPANLDQFRNLPGSTASGSSGKPRLTNLMQLTLDTSWWTRYRSSANNPDLDPNFVFPQPSQHRMPTSRPLPTQPASICRPSNKVVIASTLPWHRGPPASRCCEY
jgi:hypothetical protein